MNKGLRNLFYFCVVCWVILFLLISVNKQALDEKNRHVKAPVSGVYKIHGKEKYFKAGDLIK